MKLSELPTHQDVLEEEFERDPAYRKEWERTAIGRLVAIEIIRYRAQHDLSQRDLAGRLEVPQSQVARLELGEHNPSYQTMLRLVSKLEIELMIDIRPIGHEAQLPKKSATTHTVEADEYAVAVAVA
jgi:ribosome-binding protein aMBF1 (putative translation factor)